MISFSNQTLRKGEIVPLLGSGFSSSCLGIHHLFKWTLDHTLLNHSHAFRLNLPLNQPPLRSFALRENVIQYVYQF